MNFAAAAAAEFAGGSVSKSNFPPGQTAQKKNVPGAPV